jgi:hypothetical protein
MLSSMLNDVKKSDVIILMGDLYANLAMTIRIWKKLWVGMDWVPGMRMENCLLTFVLATG